MSLNNANQILIWDLNNTPNSSASKIMLWRSFSTHSHEISIPELVEKNAIKLKKKYLAFVYDIGTLTFDGKTLAERLKIRSNFSYWWMTQISEKNYAKSESIYNILRFMAFETWALKHNYKHYVLHSDSNQLGQSLKLWCKKHNFTCDIKVTKKIGKRNNLVTAYQKYMPYCFKGICWLLFYTLDRWPLKKLAFSDLEKIEARVIFFSYLFNIDSVSLKKKIYNSPYWGSLPTKLQENKSKSIWIHLYLKDPILPDSKTAASALIGFNKNKKNQQQHIFLDSFLTLRNVWATLCDWTKLMSSVFFLRNTIQYKLNENSHLWEFLKVDWKNSIYGSVAVSNLLIFNLFESALKFLPKNSFGIYLQENQGWEFALINAWKSGNNLPLYGSPHSSIRFWDLRYFFDTRNFLNNNLKLSLPEKILVNGPVMKKSFLEAGYNRNLILEAEALRYLNIHNFMKKTIPSDARLKKGIRLLVLTDYLLCNTDFQLNLLQQAINFLPKNTVIIVRPHPGCPILPMRYPKINFQLTKKPLYTLLDKCNMVYVSSITSAAIDAYCSGIPVITAIDPNMLNLSPLRKTRGLFFVSQPKELASKLILIKNRKSNFVKPKTFFYTDPQLHRWLDALKVIN